jgi:multiple sugar transport system substrate-binding protein
MTSNGRRTRLALVATGAAALAGVGVAGVSTAGALTARSASAATSTVTLDVFGYDNGVPAWAASTMKSFDSTHPTLKLDITVVPTTSLEQVLTTSVQGGDPPDISSMPTAWVPQFATADALTNLRTVLPAPFLKSFNTNLLNGSVYHGQLAALPYGSSTRALFYNKKEFAAAGIMAPPKTWPQLISDAATIESKKAAKYGFSLQGTGNETFAAWFPYFYWSYGGSFGSGATLHVQTQACVSALGQLNDMVNVAKVTEPNPTSDDFPQQDGLFTSGQAAMTITGPWLIPSAKGLSFGVAPIPAGTTASTLGVTDGWAVFKKAKATSAQISTVLTYLMSSANEIPFLVGRGFLPVIQSQFANSAFTTGVVKPFVTALATAKFAPLSPQWTILADQGAKVLQTLYVNGASPQTVCTGLQGLLSS